jgi:SAM-dependent methyltransferase
MNVEEEQLIEEILWKSSPRKYFAGDAWPPEIAPLKSQLRRTWNAGDYDRISRYTEAGAERFYSRLAFAPESRLLDIACGSGQIALIAARHGLDATGVDVAPDLVARARERALAEDLDAHFHEADAEDLPFADGVFDAVTSVAGVMFAPRPELAVSEMLRVCRTGGVIAMANWTRQGFVGRLFRLLSEFIAPSGMPDPLLWGDEETVRERLGNGVSGLEFTSRNLVFSFPFAPDEVVHFFRLYHGPSNRAFASLNRAGRVELRTQLEELWASHNRAHGGFTRVDAEWLEVIATRV